MTGILAAIFVFAFLIFFHELGHFLLARMLGIGVKTFSLGFGPVLFSRVWGRTTCQVAALPLGGFVSLTGEAPDEDIPEPFSAADSFSLRPAWQRLLVVAAGPVWNLALAWLLCWGLFWVNGKSEIPPVIGTILEGSPAADSPLRSGDRVLSLNGVPVSRWEDLPRFIRRNEGRPVTFVVSAQGDDLRVFDITPALLSGGAGEKAFTGWGIGVLPQGTVQRSLSFGQAAGAGLEQAADMVVLIWSGLADLFSGRESVKSVGGPLLIAQVVSRQAEQGLASLLLLTALISANLGILNLLPVPVLDGGRILFLGLELLFRRPVPLAIQEKAMLGGLFFLVGLMILATFNDIVRIFS
ncbi:MAG: RIP metalloprotease RseP [Desulfovibrio sp.]|jgi:regulator of sigma E protease|nr:RIP metalloprotease RseP [Desulfovibrio sp.]